MLKFLKLAMLALIVPVVAFGSSAVVSATSGGQIEGGNFYRAKNVTKSGNYGDPITADKCETVQFLVQIHNPGPDPIEGVRVKATLPATAQDPISSVATISATNANPTSQTDSASINLPSPLKIGYVSGSTKLLDHNAAVIQGLPDGIVGGGVSIPSGVGVSLQQIRYVQFQAKLECPQPPKEECPEGTTGTPPNCETPTTPTTPETPSTPAAPTSLPATGPEALASGVIGSGALGYGVRRWLMSRHALRNALNR